MRNESLLGSWARRFLLEHLVGERNLARNTQQSYRDALALLFPFLAGRMKKAVDRLTLEDLSRDTLRSFLDCLEKDRSCSARTRNQRLAAVHALARFVALHSPAHVEWCGAIHSVPFKRVAKPVLPYLDKAEIDALLAAPDCETRQGLRDYVLLLFLYNSGARVSEAASLRIGELDLRPKGTSAVSVMGKGRKVRVCPLWTTTARQLNRLVQGRQSDQPVFLNRHGQALTRYGIHTMLRRHVRSAARGCPSLLRKRVSPHTIRHTTATHLLRAGVDINTIRAWLGHVSIDTTNIYVEIDLARKEQMLAKCSSFRAGKRSKPWRENPSVMDFLRSL
jgi:integrase/recombinase XerD